MTEYALEGKTVQRPRQSMAGSKQSSYEHYFGVNGRMQGTIYRRRRHQRFPSPWHFATLKVTLPTCFRPFRPKLE